MPHLDFLTLYILVFLNSLTVAVVWAGFARTYRPHRAAQHWLAATLLTLAGGIVLAIQGNEGALVPAIAGNTIIIFGFMQFWIGLRRFNDLEGGLGWAVAFTLVAAACMLAMYGSDRGRAIVYASGQAMVFLICLWHFRRHAVPGLGSRIAMSAFAIAMGGQLLVVGSNAFVLAGRLDFEIYYSLASYALLCTVFSATVWNLGFALMAIDKLHRTLTRLSQTDELTGLANRRAFRARLDTLEQSLAETRRDYSVVLIDLNDFKPLNDHFGHAVGDAALQHFARLLGMCTRHGDLVARLGGDEFCILLPDTTAAQAETVAGEIKRKVATTPLTLAGHTVTLSASIGLANSLEDKGDLVILADGRLYKDKQQHKAAIRKRPASRLQLVKTP